MRKYAVLVIIFGLMSGGCAWLGFGDDSSDTATAAEPVRKEEPKNPEPVSDQAKAKEPAAKSQAKASAAGKKRAKKSEAQIKAELDVMGKKLAAQ